ncbi:MULTISPECIES: hypothetical protein [unclassified Streptomyces]|uniref:hypothetical protein n=1 Tax=unclassified Streptomyces TaxID=2593676 RepID=UPI00093E7F46|nr:hypothetical protein [Streptomyces sp. CB01883]OKJ87260.1 hypothetical protein AMK32_08450 [Streptomyces sp. CB01883]
MTAPQNHRFWITDPEPIENTAGNLARVVVSLVPASYPHVLVRIEYVIRDGEHIEGPYGVRIQQAPDVEASEWRPVGATLVRDLPMAKLERAARLALSMGLRSSSGAPLSGARMVTAAPAPDQIPDLARQLVRERHPDVNPDDGPGAARRWNRLIRLAEVQLEYAAAIASGQKAPASYVAEQRGVAAGTVRTWLHGAKQEGLEASSVPDFSAVAISPDTGG